MKKLEFLEKLKALFSRKKSIEEDGLPPAAPKEFRLSSEDKENLDNEFTSPPTKISKIAGFLKGQKEKLSSFLTKAPAGNIEKKTSAPSRFDFLKEFNWDQTFNKMFSPESRAIIHKSFLVATIAAGTYSVGKIVALTLKDHDPTVSHQTSRRLPPGTRGSLKNDIDAIKTANLFNALESDKIAVGPKKVVSKDVICRKADKPSSLPIELINTVVLQDTVKSVASVQMRGKSDLLAVRELEKIESVAEVGRIEGNRVIFKNLSSGECEFVQGKDDTPRKSLTVLPPSMSKSVMPKKSLEGIKNDGNSYTISKKLRDQMLGDISNVLTQARAIQIKNPDGSLSFKMADVVPGSIYSHLDIQNGDIITGINGKKITNLNEIMKMFGSIKDIDNLQLTINRNGNEQSKEYDFDE